MSSRRSSGASKDEINELIWKLQALLPQLNQSHPSRVSVSRILKETCSYIRKLQREVDDLSESLSQLTDPMDITGVDIESLITSILRK